MKIRLNKKQWETVGKKAGWIKQSSIPHDSESIYENKERCCKITKSNGKYVVSFNFDDGRKQVGIINDNLTDEQKDTIAYGHGRKVYACGHTVQCRCTHGGELPIQYIQDICFSCKNKDKTYFTV